MRRARVRSRVARAPVDAVVDVALVARDDDERERACEVSYAASAREVTTDVVRARARRGVVASSSVRADAGEHGEMCVWARARLGGGCAIGVGRMVATGGGARDAATTTEARARVVGLAWTGDGKGVVIVTCDGCVSVVRASDGCEAWVRESRRSGREATRARAGASETVERGSVAVTFDDERVVYVLTEGLEEQVDALRHPARVETMSWRRGTLATLCLDGALRLWTRASRGRGPAQLAYTIQTPHGGLTPVIAFDWLETRETSDVLFDHAVIGVDGASGVHVWTLSDADASHPLSARRPIVAHRGSMMLENPIQMTFDDRFVIRGSLTQSADDIHVVLASREFGVLIARADPKRPNILEQMHRTAFSGHVTSIVSMRVNPENDSLITVDASGSRIVWRRGDTGELDVADAADGMFEESQTEDDVQRASACARVGVCDGKLSRDGSKLAFVDGQGRCAVGCLVGDSDIVVEIIESVSSAGKPIFEWFDLGCGAHALAVALGSEISVYVSSPLSYASKKMVWKRLLCTDVSEGSRLEIAAMTWSSLGDALFVALDRTIYTVTCEDGIAQSAIHESRILPSYHPYVLVDWLENGKLSRVRKSLRSVVSYLRAGDFSTRCPSIPPGELLNVDESTSDVSPSLLPTSPAPSAVPEFDMSAFGAFGGAMTATPTATFSFGSDSHSTETVDLSTSSFVPHVKKTTNDAFTREEADDATELVTEHAGALDLAPTEYVRLLGVIDALKAMDSRANVALDEAGQRFIAIWNARHIDRLSEGDAPCGRELCWATQSNVTSELLHDILSDDAGVKADWSNIKRLGVPIWLRSDDDLRVLIEKCAKAEFARTKNADDSALFFVIVDRVKVLAGLYKATQNSRLYEFMCRDFNEERHQEAALKNAYALLSKHRYTYAAAFFVLGGKPLDAASIVWKHERDLSLALAIARLAGCADATHSQSKSRLPDEVKSILARDVAPVTTDAWMLLAICLLTGDHEQFLSSAKSLLEAHDWEAADFLTFASGSQGFDSELALNTKSLVRRYSGRLAYALDLLGAPLSALERYSSHLEDDAIRLAARSFSIDDTAQELDAVDIRVFEGEPWRLDRVRMLETLRRRMQVSNFVSSWAHVNDEVKTPSPEKCHTKSTSALPSEIRPVTIPRVPSGQDLSIDGSPTEKVARAQNAFSRLRRLSIKSKRQKSASVHHGEDSPSTPTTPVSPSNQESNGSHDDKNGQTHVLRTPVTVATLQNDGFYDVCFNHEVPYELGCASVRQGLSVVSLRKLNESDSESQSDAWAVLLRAQPPVSGFKSTMNSWLHYDDAPSSPSSPRGGNVREHEWATHAGLDMTSLTGIIPQSQGESVGRNRSAIKREVANDVVARSVAAHPTRSFFAVGTSAGGVQLWDFHGKNADNAAAVLSLGGKKATSGTGASTRALAWSPHGARLAACTSDGNVTLWLGDAPDAEPAANKMCGFKGCKTEDVLFLSTNLLAVASSNGGISASNAPECVVLWDALQSAHASPGIIRAHSGGCTALTQFPSLVAPHGVPWPFLITGGFGGDVAAHDLRMLGGDGHGTVLWRSSAPQAGTIASIAAIHHETTPIIIAGDQAGDLVAYSALDGAPLQRVTSAHPCQKFLTPRGGGALASLGVSTVLPIHDGVLTSGGDGAVRCFRLSKSLRGARSPLL